MSANKWFKFYGGEYLSDPKVSSLTVQERSCWVTLLCLASMNGEEGFIEFLTVETLLIKSGIQFDPYHPDEWDKALSVLKKFQRMRMIELSENGDINILNWSKRQESNLTDAERAKNYRDRKRIVTEPSHSNVTNVTLDKNRIEENNISIKKTAGDIFFEEFWKLYPRKIGKQAAFKKWMVVTKNKDAQEIINSLKLQLKANVFSQEMRFVKHPEVWLNKGCWDDEIPKEKYSGYFLPPTVEEKDSEATPEQKEAVRRKLAEVRLTFRSK